MNISEGLVEPPFKIGTGVPTASAAFAAAHLLPRAVVSSAALRGFVPLVLLLPVYRGYRAAFPFDFLAAIQSPFGGHPKVTKTGVVAVGDLEVSPTHDHMKLVNTKFDARSEPTDQNWTAVDNQLMECRSSHLKCPGGAPRKSKLRG